ncbi:MAG: MFS transporter [Akkermansiaceae bacterium]|nr:MFS transporter [Akkermansiaceae bacterium]
MSRYYGKTLVACYLGFVTQAIAANYVPLLFLTLKHAYCISFELLALIPVVFYITQLLVDLAASQFVDKIGYRLCVVASQLLAAAGLVLLEVLPELLPVPFAGVLVAVVLYAVGSGLIEVLVSPIVEACPFENKSGMMSLLHSFYCWGAVAVILGSSLFFSVFGIENRHVLTLLWALIPLYNAFNFMTCPINQPGEEGGSMRPGALLRLPVFWLLILLMVCAGASEASMAQWASAFTEVAVGVSKMVGDIAGPCMFAVFMGVSRILYGRMSRRLDLCLCMLFCGLLCVICYLTAALCSVPVVGLAGCALCGAAVGILWPGTISLSSRQCPAGGTAMFAFLALAGDFGATLGPGMVGCISDMGGGDLKLGLLGASVFPLLLLGVLIILHRLAAREKRAYAAQPEGVCASEERG